ncbi:Secretory carrier-associated membrane protein 1 [Halotydeus destructor]|nr:Secretory carrier-associated membrane protein 1 [Halotydeus destructor]
MYFVVVLIANFFAGLATWIHLGELGTFGFGFFGLVILTPLSFFCWFRPLYKAFRSDSSVNFMVFFFVFFCQLVLAIIWAIGLNGATGLITAIESIGKGFLYSFLIFSVATSTILYAVCSFLVLVKVHSIYRNTGASFAKAQAEFSQGVMSNETVRNAAAGAARQAMSSAFTGPNQSGNGAGGLRY